MIDALVGKKIGVINGGFSEERDVSLRSGANVLAALQKKGYDAFLVDPAVTNLLEVQMDVAFLTLHGPYGEDGSVQSLLELYGIPYTGSGHLASILGMNKWLTKTILQKENFPTPKFQVVTAHNAHVLPPFSFPVIIKPTALGSSVGVVICEREADYPKMAQDLVDHFECCLVEECISGQEITVGVIEKSGVPSPLPILELIPQNRFYDYDAKYTPNKTTFVLPANLSPQITQTCQELAIKLHQLLGCKGASRTDMIVDPEKGPMILEINTLPGMTDTSDLPAQAKAAGIPFEDLVERILESALSRD
jgi:D-alanine-D-alanine ligase